MSILKRLPFLVLLFNLYVVIIICVVYIIMFGGIIKSIARGAVGKALIKGAVRGVKAGSRGILKGMKRGATMLTRGLKSGSAQARVLPKAVTEAVAFGKTLPKGFGAKNTLQVMRNSIARDLARASKGALNKDSAMRLSSLMAKAVTNSKQSKVLKQIMKNVRANETWGQYAKRMGRKAGNLVKQVVREGGENVVVDQSISATAKAAGTLGVAGVGGAVTGAVVASKK